MTINQGTTRLELYEDGLVNYTVRKDFLATLDDVNLVELHKNKNKWLDIRFADKNKQGTRNEVPTGDITNVNNFTYKNIPQITCILLAVASAMWAMGISV